MIHRLFSARNFKIKTLSDVPEMLSEREVGAIQGKRMKSFKSSFTMYSTWHTEEDKQWSRSRRKMKQIRVKNITVLLDGRTFTKSVATIQLLKKLELNTTLCFMRCISFLSSQI